MNKHVIAFLSVFSLGLVLSVYYVFIPKNQNSTPVQGTITSEAELRKAYFDGLDKQRNEYHKNIIDDLNIKLTNCKESEKEKYINLIEVENSYISAEKSIEKKISELGYDYSVCQVDSTRALLNYYTSTDKDEVELTYLIMEEFKNENKRVELVYAANFN